MHALSQMATRKWLEANRKLEQWKQCYIKNLSAEFSTGEHANWTHCQVLFPNAKLAVHNGQVERGRQENGLHCYMVQPGTRGGKGV